MPRTVKTYTHDGRTMTLKEWSEATGIKYTTLVMRMASLKWTFEEAVTSRRDPKKHLKRANAKRYRFKGKDRTLAEWAGEYGTKPGIIYMRLHQYGWTIAEAITGRRKGKWSPNNPGNKRPEKQLTFRGVTKGVSEWAADRGIRPDRIRGRLNLGWTVAEAITGEKKDKWKWKARRHGVQSE